MAGWWDSFVDWWDGEEQPTPQQPPPVNNEQQRAAEFAAHWRSQLSQYQPAPTVVAKDPLEDALRQWQAPAKPDPIANMVNYDVPQAPPMDYTVDRPDLGFSLQGPPVQSPTVDSRVVAPITPVDPYAPVQSRGWGIQQFGGGNQAMANASLPLAAATQAYNALPGEGLWDKAGNMLGLAGQAIGDSAAVERMQYDIDQRYQERQGNAGRGWGEWVQDAAGNVGDAWSGLQGALAKQTMGDGNILDIAGAELGLGASLVGGVAGSTRPTQYIADQAMNVASGLQATQDLTNALPVTDGVTLGQGLVAGATGLLEAVKEPFQQDDGGVGAAFMNTFKDVLRQYDEAVTPTAAQAAGMSPVDIARNRDRAQLNWADPASVAKTFDALVDQSTTVKTLTDEARRLYEAGAAEQDEDARAELWAQAADKGAEAYKLQNTHPVALVNDNTNIWRQLAFELLQPDITDLASGIIEGLELGIKGRRLAATAGDVLQPAEKVAEDLATLAVGPQTKAAMMAERSTYNPMALWNPKSWWTTGQAQAHQATDALHRFTANLMTDVDTVADAKILMRQMAQDPSKLITGMDANLFQSAGLLERAGEDGLIRFGTMNLQNIKEPIRIFQQVAGEFLNTAQSLAEGPLLNKIDFASELNEAMNVGGYRFYNVANELGSAPLGTITTRLKTVPGDQYVIEYVDSAKKVVGQSEPMLLSDARKQQQAIAGQLKKKTNAQTSVVGAFGSAARGVVSPMYIYASPGTWVTNIIGGVATAIGDGSFAGGALSKMDDHLAKLYGVDPTVRGLQGVDTTMSMAGQAKPVGLAGKILEPVRKAYSSIDENMGKRVYYQSVTHALKRTGRNILANTLTPILQNVGIVDPKQVRQITDHLFEVGYSGGNLTEEFNKLLNGQTRVFSLTNVNSQWLDALSPDSLQGFYDIIRKAPDKATAMTQLQQWMVDANKYWDNLIQEAPVVPQRHVWMKEEVMQDTADLSQAGKMAEKYAGVSADEVTAWKKSTTTAMQDVQRRMETLVNVVTDAANPDNRYVLYDVWGMVNDMTSDVRAKLGALAEQANMMPAAQRAEAWGNYWKEARQLWDERNAKVSNLLESSAAAIAKGEDFRPNVRQWDILERAAQVNEQKLWDTLRLEPGSGAYDQRLAQIIEAGRQISDKAVARTYAAARRFVDVNAMDYIISAEKNVQMAGAQARSYLDLALDSAMKSGKWEDYFQIRNEVWRQLRQYEKEVWGLATRNIVSDGLGVEAKTGLRFDAGIDGVVEVIRPEQVNVQRTDMRGPQKSVTQQPVTDWIVRREDGTTTRIADGQVPQDIKDRYKGITQQEIDGQVELELDNIASVNPFADEAQAIIDAPGGVTGAASQVKKNMNLGSTAAQKDMQKISDATNKATTGLGGTQAPDIALAAMHAKEQLQNIYQYVAANIDDILTPKGALSQGQSLRAVDEFRRTALPAWDNAKFIASEFGNKMRSFTMVDFANTTRLDEVMGTLIPYGFWFTRSAKNSLERALFEPHIWRRVMQAERELKEMQQQRGDPNRYQGSIPIDMGNGTVYYLRVSPSKYWPTFGMFTANDYADPESANNAYSFAVESMAAANASPYPWIKTGSQMLGNLVDGKPYSQDIYPASFLPQGRLAGWAATYLLGYNLPNAIRPGYYEYNVARELTTMVSEGEITAQEAQWAQDILRQMKTGEDELPEQAAVGDRLTEILDQATRRAANKELIAASSSLLTGFGVRPFDTDENKAVAASQTYRDREYNAYTNPYGSETAQNYTFDQYPELSPKFSQGSIRDTEDVRPGARAAKSALIEETQAAREALYAAGNSAVDNLLASNPGASKKEIDNARSNAIYELAKQYVDPAKLASIDPNEFSKVVVDIVIADIEAKWPSADLVDASDKPKSYNPVEQKDNFQESILKQAPLLFPYPEYPEGGTPAQIAAYMKEKAAVDAKREKWLTGQLTTGGSQQIMPNWMKGSTALDSAAMTTTPQDAQSIIAADKDKYKTEAEKKRLDQIEQERAAKNAEYERKRGEFAARRASVADYFGEGGATMWDQYYALPKGEARKKFIQDNPVMRAINLYAYNKDEMKTATELFGDNALAQWALAPAYADTDEARKARSEYWDSNPNAFLFHSWLNGRPSSEDESAQGEEEFSYNFGKDYAEAKVMFGEDIWTVVEGYKRGWNSAMKRGYYDKYPQLTKFFEWWYGNLPKKEGSGSGSTGSGRSGGGGGGGGGYSQAPKGRTQVNIQPVYGQGLARGLGEQPSIRGYAPSRIDTSWMNTGRELRPGEPKRWSPSWIRGGK